jgi:hypothetical protein
MGLETKSASVRVGGEVRAGAGRSERRWSDAQILAAADFSVPRIRPPSGYVAALGVLATALVFVPLIYLALVAFLTWIFLWHAGQTFASLSLGPFFIFHVPMAILGGVLIVFLVKPVFFRGKATEEGVVALTREAQPLLFAFVEKTCQSIGVIAPAVIEVDCQVNAHVAMRRGLISVVGGDLTLRIGLPLVAGFSLQQFAGVLAHEFGHFSQIAGRNSSYLIYRMIGYFHRVVFQRDRLDAWLLRLRSNRSARGRLLLFWLLAGPVEAVRGLLWLLMIASEILCSRVRRQMEYDADVVGSQICGVDNFIRVSKLSAFLEIASGRARQDLAGTLDQLRLADDLPRLIVTNARQLVEHRGDILAALEKDQTGWFDTHPSYADRMRNVKESGAVGLLVCDEPARRLFADFDGLCKSATQSFYRAVLGEKMAAVKMVPATELAAESAGQRQTMKALRRFFQDQLILSRCVIPGPEANRPIENARAAVAQLREVRDAMVQSASAIGDLSERYRKAEAELLGANATVDLCSLFSGNPRIYPLRLRGVTQQNRCQKVITDARSRLIPFEQAATGRFTTAIGLLKDDRIRARIAPTLSVNGNADHTRPEFAGLLLGVLREMLPFMATVAQLRQATVTLRVHIAAWNPRRPYPPLAKKINGMSAEIVRKLTRLKAHLDTLPYPFEHGLNVGAVGDVLVQDLPDPANPMQACAAAGRVAYRFDFLMVRIIGSLTEWAEKVETAVGLEPLVEPPDREDARELENQGETRRHSRKYWVGYGTRATAGMVMLIALIWLSISPPALSGWGDQAGITYRPAAFSTVSFQPARPEIRLPGAQWMPANPAFRPSMPPMPSMPVFHPPTMPQNNWGTPQFSHPQPMQPFVPQTPQFQPPTFQRPAGWPPRPPGGGAGTGGRNCLPRYCGRACFGSCWRSLAAPCGDQH